jgi:3-deoxy-D-manno-octulosonate 8-phosphate phosphatase KdsC-like HAD superfamily phosphatase
MAPATVRAVVADLGPAAVWAVDREHDRLLGPGWPDVLADRPGHARTVTELPDGRSIVCLMVHGGDDGSAALLGVRHAVVATSSAPGLLEFSAPGADKVSAVRWLLDRTGTPWTSVLAFGDGLNDLGMLTAAGRGVAVANASPQVLAVADDVAPHHDDDGVARWLEEHLCPATPKCPVGTV